VGGGIPPRLIDALRHGSFMAAFTSKGRLSDLMKRIPVHVILHPKTALIGAALSGFEYTSTSSRKETRRV
jgi:glucokinase